MLNLAIIRGYVADDPFIRATEGGKFARLRVVTVEKIVVRKTNSIRMHTEWHTIALWGDHAEVADRKIRIGSAIQIEGALRTRSWQDKDGVTNKATEISAHKLEILNSIDGAEIPDFIVAAMPASQSSKATSTKLEVKRPIDDPDDLPF
ncbi:MAG: single-stranded DNA-binding protein [Rikenellaceae bacterium]